MKGTELGVEFGLERCYAVFVTLKGAEKVGKIITQSFNSREDSGGRLVSSRKGAIGLLHGRRGASSKREVCSSCFER